MTGSSSLSLSVFCHIEPYPATNGAAVDMSRRLEALKSLGIRLQVIVWQCEGEEPSQKLEKALHSVAEDVVILRILRDWPSKLRKSLLLAKYPLEEASRWLPKSEVEKIIDRIRAFNPTAVFQDGLHGSRLSLKVCQTLEKPLLYRSHNIEYVYARRLLASASGLSRIRRFLTLKGCYSLETQVIRQAKRVYDISMSDISHWEKLGYRHFRWLPPIANIQNINRSQENWTYDIGFIGNLRMDNNIDGVTWFLNEVLPHLRTVHAHPKILIAGSTPRSHLQSLCQSIAEVTLIADPEDLRPLYEQTHVFINPVRQGSGVKIKTLEMLGMGVPFVSTREGVSGLPASIQNSIAVTDQAQQFAHQLSELLQESNAHSDPTNLRALFSEQSHSVILEELKTC